MFRFLSLLCMVLMCSRAATQVVLSEIMFNPEGNERYDEFIELYNAGEEAVDLFAWLLSDGEKFNTILPFENSSVLQPQHFALIFVPNYFQNSNSYEADIPEDVLMLSIDKSQFGAYGLKNTEGETVSIYRPDTTLIARYRYSPDNEDGHSEEKINLSGEDRETNWQNSVKKGGTPGRENSVTPKPYDLALMHFLLEPQNPSIKDTLKFHFTIKNLGTHAVEECELVVLDSIDHDIITLCHEKIDLTGLAAEDSLQHLIVHPPLEAGEHYLSAILQNMQDERLENNKATVFCRVVETFPPGCILFSEVMYDTDEKSDEWIEIYNASNVQINIKEWTIKDKKKKLQLTMDNFFLKPGDFCVLTNTEQMLTNGVQLTTALPELNNSGDELVLFDAADVVIDSLSYDRSFGGARHVSTERIRFTEETNSAANWGSCTHERGSTPGELNSICPKEYDAAILGALHFTPAQPMAGESVMLSAKISNAGLRELENIAVHLFYCPLHQTELIPIDQKTIQHLDKDENRVIDFFWPNCMPGVHAVRVDLSMPFDMQAENNSLVDTISVSYAAGSLVINEMMYSPLVDESEWIELMNVSTTPIELMFWTISDSNRQVRLPLSTNSCVIQPNEFLVAYSDSSSFDPFIDCTTLIRALPSLNNTADAVVLYDACGRIVEEVTYTSAWGGATGRSLERINPRVRSSEITNWTTCVHTAGHTAGYENSVFTKILPKSTSLTISPDPFSPDGDGMDDFVALSYALPSTLAHVNLKVFDIRGRLVRFLLNNEPSGAERTIYWDGLDDSGIKCRMGIYVVLFEALNENKMCIERSRQTVVLAGAL